jgi:hypothetical protein
MMIVVYCDVLLIHVINANKMIHNELVFLVCFPTVCNICKVSHWMCDIGDKPLNNNNYIYIFRNIKNPNYIFFCMSFFFCVHVSLHSRTEPSLRHLIIGQLMLSSLFVIMLNYDDCCVL